MLFPGDVTVASPGVVFTVLFWHKRTVVLLTTLGVHCRSFDVLTIFMGSEELCSPPVDG